MQEVQWKLGGLACYRVWAASSAYVGEIEIVLDSPNGTCIGRCKVSRTGGWRVWRSLPDCTDFRRTCRLSRLQRPFGWKVV
ncbi:carbohydrate-binding protein [Paenibacillus sp. 2TAB19]|uniref:carbohydrate-binding protein n=1 Tax=Paenibacillus sp. 2TAB19 TaxID=3233003 RepID=UPI003F956C8D